MLSLTGGNRAHHFTAHPHLELSTLCMQADVLSQNPLIHSLRCSFRNGLDMGIKDGTNLKKYSRLPIIFSCSYL